MPTERRQSKRWARHLQVRFTPLEGSGASHAGFTTNISRTGMFITTPMVFPSGTRLRVELIDPARGFVVEAVVARSLKSAPELRRVRAQGMGVRFLSVEELVGELLPAAGSPTVEVGPPQEGVYRMRFPAPALLAEAVARDVATGGLFVPTQHPAPVRSEVKVEISVAGVDLPPVVVAGRVVQRFEPGAPTGTSGANLVAGMGVELDDPVAATEALLKLANNVEG